jgi:hypothetical protein
VKCTDEKLEVMAIPCENHARGGARAAPLTVMSRSEEPYVHARRYAARQGHWDASETVSQFMYNITYMID